MNGARLVTVLGAPVDAYYVDSNVLRSGSGRSPGSPLKALGELPTAKFTARTRVRLARGSTFREKLTPTSGITIEAYGTGAAPVIDASDPVSAGAWSAHSGSCYKANVSIAPVSGHPYYVRAYDAVATAYLTRAADLATCISTAGTYWPSADTGTSITLYVHLTDESDPASNGRTVYYTARSAGIEGYTATGVTVRDIVTQHNGANDGSLIGWRRWVLERCTAYWGAKHSIYVGGGSVLRDCVAAEATAHPDGGTLYVWYEAAPVVGSTVTFIRCAASMSALDPNVNGFFGHTSGYDEWVARYGAVTYVSCTATNCAVGFSGQHSSLITIRNCTATGCQYGAYAYCPVRVEGPGCNGSVLCVSLQAHGSVTLGPTCVLAAAYNEGAIQGASGNNTVTVESGATITGTGGVGIYLYGAGCSVVSNGGDYQISEKIRHTSDDAFTYVGDYNNFHGPGALTVFQLNATDYKITLAAWQAATGQDAHST